MSLIKPPNSPFFYSTHTIDGKTYRKTTRTKNRRAAELVDEAFRVELIEKLYGDNESNVTLTEAFNEYIIFRDEQMTGQYQLIIDELKDPYLKNIKTKDLINLTITLRNKQFKERTIKMYFSHLKLLLNFAKKQGHAVPDDLEFPALKYKKKQIRIITIAEETKLLELLDPKRECLRLPSYDLRTDERKAEMQATYDFTVMLIDTGARMNEIAKLKWEDVNLVDKTIHLRRSKVNNSSILALTTRAFNILDRRNLTKNTDWVFTSREGGHRRPNNNTLRETLKKVDESLTIHSLRHIYASRLIGMGVSLYEVSKILGHSHTTMTENYSHLDAQVASVKAAEILNDAHERNEQDKLNDFVKF